MSSESTAAPLEHGEEARSRALTWSLDHRSELLVWGAIVAWSAALFAIVRDDFANFRLGRFDLGNMVQAVWSTAHGRPLEATTMYGDQLVRLGSHVDPILVLFVPLWLVAPTPLTLLAVNIGALALGALPVFWLARRHLVSESAVALLALSYLAYPWLSWAALDAFHPVVLAIPLLLFCIWFLETDRLGAFTACAIPAALTGELIGVTIAALGIWYALARGRHWAGLVITGVGIAWTAVAVYVVVPAFSEGSNIFYGYYGSVGGSPTGVIRTVFSDPGAIVAALFSSRDIGYVVLLSAPLAGMFVLAPGLAVVAAPQLLANALSDSVGFTDPRHHYIAAAVPILIAAVVIGLGRLGARRQVSAATAVLTLCIGWSLLAGAWPGAPANPASWDSIDVPASHPDALRAAVSLVPDGAPVSATNKAGSHLSARQYFYSPLYVGNAEWIVLDTLDPFVANPGFPVLERNPEALDAFRNRIEGSVRWSKVFERDGVLVFRKAGER